MKKDKLRKIIRELIEKQFYKPSKGSIDDCNCTRNNECPEGQCCDGCNCYDPSDSWIDHNTGEITGGEGCPGDMKEPDNKMFERIGFRGPDYADETKDLFSDFQASVEMLSKEFKEKSVSGDSAEIQEILTTLDDTLNPEFIENLDTILSLIRELPDKPEKQKIGFREEKKKGLDGKACWDGYKLQGTKMKGGKRVDNCVPINEIEADDDTEFTVTLQHLLDKHVTKGGEVDEIDAHTEDVLMLEVIDENITEAKYKGKTVTLNKPMQGDSKKFKVYVNSGKKNADGSIKVKKVNFGAKGMKIRKSNPKARKAFRARHRCDNPGPKTMARYWSCKKW